MNSHDYRNIGIEHRRFLHMHPELGRKEYVTSEYCRKQLEQLGYVITPALKRGL